MADIYVRSTDGSDSDNGSTWALAKATLAGAAAIEAAGDTINLSSAHAESTAAAQGITLAGTSANPVRVLSVNDGAAPPTATAIGASVTTTGGNNIGTRGAAYFYGITFSAGSGFVNAQLELNDYSWSANTVQVYDRCTLLVTATGGAAILRVNHSTIANSTDNRTRLVNSDIRVSSGSTAAAIDVTGRLEIEGGSYLSGGGTNFSALIAGASGTGRGCTVRMDSFNMTNAPAAMSLFRATSMQSDMVARNVKLPSSWTGSLVSGTPNVADRFAMYNCDSGDTNYRLWVQTFFGSILDETTIVRTGGASDGTTPISWKMISASSASYPLGVLESPEIVRRYPGTTAEEAAWSPGASVTVSVEIITDGVTLKDGECWLEVQYLGTSGAPLGVFASDAKSDVLAAAANQTSSSEAWTTTGMTTPTKQKLSVTITPQEKGVIHAVVKLAKASTTVYVDPKLVLS